MLLGCYVVYIGSYFTDVSRKPLFSIFKGQTVQKRILVDGLALEDGTDRFSRNVGK